MKSLLELPTWSLQVLLLVLEEELLQRVWWRIGLMEKTALMIAAVMMERL
jgi:hypothetical protein